MTVISSDDGVPAIIVFTNNRTSLVLRPLRPGFRHCFAVLKHDRAWVACDPLKDRITLALMEVPTEFDLPAFYAARGHAVLVGRTSGLPLRPRLVPSLLTCVAIVKRLIGLRAPSIVTPWQLYRYLRLGKGGGTWQPFAPVNFLETRLFS